MVSSSLPQAEILDSLQTQYMLIPIRANTSLLYKDLGKMPYKVQLVQELKPIDHSKQFRYAKWACHRLTEDERPFSKQALVEKNA